MKSSGRDEMGSQRLLGHECWPDRGLKGLLVAPAHHEEKEVLPLWSEPSVVSSPQPCGAFTPGSIRDDLPSKGSRAISLVHLGQSKPNSLSFKERSFTTSTINCAFSRPIIQTDFYSTLEVWK